jgi:hypothetical protein
MGVLQCILYALQYALTVLLIHHGWEGQNHEFGSVRQRGDRGSCIRDRGEDEPESLILAQSERWRHA